jgi:hypothetical protein
MLSKATFIRLMTNIHNIENTVNKFCDILKLSETVLDEYTCELLEAIAHEVEPISDHWVDDSPAVFRYAGDFAWGDGWYTYVDNKHWPIGDDIDYNVIDLDTLYDYIIAKKEYFRNSEVQTKID